MLLDGFGIELITQLTAACDFDAALNESSSTASTSAQISLKDLIQLSLNKICSLLKKDTEATAAAANTRFHRRSDKLVSPEAVNDDRNIKRLRTLLNSVSSHLAKNATTTSSAETSASNQAPLPFSNTINKQSKSSKKKQQQQAKQQQVAEATVTSGDLNLTKAAMARIDHEDVMECMRLFCNDQSVSMMWCSIRL